MYDSEDPRDLNIRPQLSVIVRLRGWDICMQDLTRYLVSVKYDHNDVEQLGYDPRPR